MGVSAEIVRTKTWPDVNSDGIYLFPKYMTFKATYLLL